MKKKTSHEDFLTKILILNSGIFAKRDKNVFFFFSGTLSMAQKYHKNRLIISVFDLVSPEKNIIFLGNLFSVKIVKLKAGFLSSA